MRVSLRRLAGGAAKPHWGDPPKNRWQPFIPDRMHYGEHPTYTGFVLWLRGLRPKIENIGASVWKVTTCLTSIVYNPIRNSVVRHNPDVRYQFVALVSFFSTTWAITYFINLYYQGILDISNLLSLGTANDLNEHGFWNSKDENIKNKVSLFNSNVKRLNRLWEEALFTSTEEGSFDRMCQFLKVDPSEVSTGVMPSTIWGFNMIPYGKDNPDTLVFTNPSILKPLRSVAINFTYNNQFGNWGDYINRQDNKSALFRPARPLFTDVYIPGTK